MAPSPPTDAPSTDASPLEASIQRALAGALAAEPPTEAAAERAAAELDGLYPAAGPAAAAEDFLWTLWSLLIDAVKKVPPGDDTRQRQLVALVAALPPRRDDAVELWGQQTRVWTELPMLGPCMRDAWSLRPDLDGAGADDAAVGGWISLNSFAARMFGAGLASWVNFAIWELRAGLEEQLPALAAARDVSLATACQWITHAGKALHEQGRQAQQLDAMEQRALKPGRLLEGVGPGLSDERWRFWRERIGALGAGAGSGELKERTQTAVDRMKELEGSG